MKEVRAWAVTDEEILKAVVKEMGLEWVDGPGPNTVAGIPVSEYLKSHSILDGDDNMEDAAYFDGKVNGEVKDDN